MFMRYPLWARTDLPDDNADEETAFFRAGAALASLDRLLVHPLPCQGAWLDRLALGAAAATAAWAGRPEQEEDIRDAYRHRQMGAEIGPAGRHYLFWRRLVHPVGLSVEAVRAAAVEIGQKPEDRLESLAEAAIALAEGSLSPVRAAAAIAEEAIRACPTSLPLALWLADAVLARRLRWPVAVPLLARPLLGRRFTAGKIGGMAWRKECALAYAEAAARAYASAEQMAARADMLLMVQHQIRAKETSAMVALLLENDAVAPSAGPSAMSDRARRRLLERLVGLDAVRELTGRPSFRLYGL
ncbi:DUF1403 family protein [Telmatospirillum sp. J64-1]|uniref:DUF1403 family protein n=1 Tax=Telmatospirillum sp. J64-1 TaxID=2502183 RepID=UPI00115EF2A5|nr:DUF1403 family protein [Telmatospirillum sp. J64-1]